MKSSHKKSNRMLLGAGIFLVVYLLFSVVFGSVLINRFSSTMQPNQNFTQVTFWHNW